MNGIDRISIVVILMMHSVLWFYVIYITMLTIIRLYYKHTLVYFSFIFRKINTFYMFFFGCFLWVLYTPFTEVHAGLLVIGANSFLVSDQDLTSYSQKSKVYMTIGILGVTLTFLIGCVLTYCYITYDFYEQNLLKRNLKHIQIFQLFSRSIYVTLYYVNMGNVLIIKHVFAHIMGITALYDYFTLVPFRDEFICTFYGCASCIYEYTIIIFSFWELTNLLPEYNLFFLWVMLSSFLVFFMMAFYKWKYYTVLLIHPTNLRNNHLLYRLDLFLENIYDMSIFGESDEVKKLKLEGILYQFFQKPIKGLKLFESYKYREILTNHKKIDENKIIEFLNELFQIFLNNAAVRQNPEVYETVMMKYCTFLSNFQHNPIRAYYELTKLLMLGKKQKNNENKGKSNYNYSIIFQVISGLISDQIEKKIASDFMEKQKISLDCKKSEYSINHATDKLNLSFLPRINEILMLEIKDLRRLLKLKIEFYEKLQIGYKTLDEVLKTGISYIKLKNVLKNLLDHRISQILDEDLNKNPVILRLNWLFSMIILNDQIDSLKYKKRRTEIAKKDSIQLDLSSYTSFLQLNTIVISITLLQKGGHIINKKTHKMANFFGYDVGEFQAIKSIENVMPLNIAIVHQEMIDRFIKKGPITNYFVNDRPIYAINKRKYVFPINLRFTLTLFYENDYCLSAFLTKIGENLSNMDIIFNEDGEIFGITEGFIKEMKSLENIDVNELYKNMNCFYFMPDLLDDMPTDETIENYIQNKEMIIEIISNKVQNFYFVRNMLKILNFLKLNKSSHGDKSSRGDKSSHGDKSTQGGKIKKEKKVIRRFTNANGYKSFVSKKLVQFSLRLEIIPLKSSKSQLKLFVLSIKQIYEESNLEYLNLSYSICRSTFLSSGTMISDSRKSLIDKDNKDTKKSFMDKETNMEIGNADNDEENINNDEDFIPAEFKKKAYLSEKISEKSIISRKSKKVENLIPYVESSESFKQIEKKTEVITEKTEGFNKKNTGQTLVRSVIDNKKSNKLLKKIIVISFFQIICFFSMNIMCEQLISQKLQVFQDKTNEIQNNMIFMKSFYQSSFVSNFMLLEDQGFLNEDISDNNTIFDDLVEDSYNKLKSLEGNQLFQEGSLIEIIFNVTENIENDVNFPDFTIRFVIMTFIYDFMNGIYTNISFFLSNLLNFTKLASEVSSNDLNDLDDTNTSFSAFYLYLNIICFIFGFSLQMISFPLIKQYALYLERILLIVTRLQDKECLLEITKLKSALKKLESPEEIYLKDDFHEFQDMKANEESFQEMANNKRKLKKSYNISILSNKINENKLSNKSSVVFFLVSMAIIGLYYMIIFVYMKKIQSNLDNSSQLLKFTNSYYVCLNKMDLFRMIILINKQKTQSFLIKDQEINYFLNDLNECVSILQANNNDILPNVLEDSLGSMFSQYASLFNDDLCSNYQETCDMYNLANLEFGIKGYSSFLFNKIAQYNDILQNNNTINIEIVKENLLLEETLDNTINSYYILMGSLDLLLNATNFIENSLFNTIQVMIIWLFLIGGLGCSCVLMLINVFRYKMMKNEIFCTKEMLCLIPLSKLMDESTIQMLKNLEK